jgi:hypothetical protein
VIYLGAIAIAIMAGIAAGGNLKGVAKLKFRKGWIFFIAFFSQVLLQIFSSAGVTISNVFALFSCVIVYLLLSVGFLLNRHISGLPVIWIGMLLNAAAMLANGGKMPVDTNILSKYGMIKELEAVSAGIDIKHIPMDANTKLAFLCDRFRPPSVLAVMSGVISIGDMVIAFGLFALVFSLVYNLKKA